MQLAVSAIAIHIIQKTDGWLIAGYNKSSHQFRKKSVSRVPPGHGKSWNLERPFSRPGKSWKIAKVMEKSWKMMIMSWNFYYCTEHFCKSDTTSFIKSNYEP